MSVHLPRDNLLGVLSIATQGEAVDKAAILRGELRTPIGSPRLRDLAQSGKKVVIVTSDPTRLCPLDRMLPPVVDKLAAAGVGDADCTDWWPKPTPSGWMRWEFCNPTFEAWMRDAHVADQLLARIQREFVLGGHKAGAITSALKRAGIYLVSALPADVVRRCRITPSPDVDSALEAAIGQLATSSRVLVISRRGAVLPVVPG